MPSSLDRSKNNHRALNEYFKAYLITRQSSSSCPYPSFAGQLEEMLILDCIESDEVVCRAMHKGPNVRS